jgi:hypothetical protein
MKAGLIFMAIFMMVGSIGCARDRDLYEREEEVFDEGYYEKNSYYEDELYEDDEMWNDDYWD